MRALCIDLFCGLGGWSEGFLLEGYRCVGFDIERHDYGSGGYPGELVLQDILTVHGSQFREATCIVASPPCQRYSYMAMPWTRAKSLIAWHKESPERIKELNALFDACFRIQIEASKAAGRYIPMVVENVKGAQPWVGRAKWHYGSFYLWGDVPALMPSTLRAKVPGVWQSVRGGKKGISAVGFNVMARRQQKEGLKLPKGNCSPRQWKDREIPRLNDGQKGVPHAPTGHWTNPAENGTKGSADQLGGDRRTWFDGGLTKLGSRSNARKAASAMIAKITLPLSQHIARVFKP